MSSMTTDQDERLKNLDAPMRQQTLHDECHDDDIRVSHAHRPPDELPYRDSDACQQTHANQLQIRPSQRVSTHRA